MKIAVPVHREVDFSSVGISLVSNNPAVAFTNYLIRCLYKLRLHFGWPTVVFFSLPIKKTGFAGKFTNLSAPTSHKSGI